MPLQRQRMRQRLVTGGSDQQYGPADIVVSNPNPTQGSQVSVFGIGFTPYSPLTSYIQPSPGSGALIAVSSGASDQQGSASFMFTVGMNISPGSVNYFVKDAAGLQSNVVTLTVQGPTITTPPPPTAGSITASTMSPVQNTPFTMTATGFTPNSQLKSIIQSTPGSATSVTLIAGTTNATGGLTFTVTLVTPGLIDYYVQDAAGVTSNMLTLNVSATGGGGTTTVTGTDIAALIGGILILAILIGLAKKQSKG